MIIANRMIVGKLSHTDVECANDSHCHCLFELWKDGEVIAACPSIEAHDAARRLICNFDGLCDPTEKS